MNTRKHARLTFARRRQMVQQLTFEGFSFAQAAAEHGVTLATARKWLARYLAGDESALEDESPRPAKSPRSISPTKALLFVELRRRPLLQARIAQSVGVSESAVSRVLARTGLSKLSDPKPVEPVQRYEHEAPGGLLHIDPKKLGRIMRPSHRVTGDRRDSAGGARWETLLVAVDDHARISFTEMQPDEKTPKAVQFLCDAAAHDASLGVRLKRPLTDNGSAFRPRDFVAACKDLGIHHRFTLAYRPRAQRHGRTLHLVCAARVGLRLGVSALQASHRSLGQLDAPLQMASSSQRHRRCRTNDRAQCFRT